MTERQGEIFVLFVSLPFNLYVCMCVLVVTSVTSRIMMEQGGTQSLRTDQRCKKTYGPTVFTHHYLLTAKIRKQTVVDG